MYVNDINWYSYTSFGKIVGIYANNLLAQEFINPERNFGSN